MKTFGDPPARSPRPAEDLSDPIEPFEALYRRKAPVWDIGRPQEVFVNLARAGRIRGKVLDIGCGTGENALFLAGLGHDVLGLDIAPTAIEQARRKAAERAVALRFEVADARHLADLAQALDTVIDSGVFHVFADEDRARFVSSLATALSPGGRCFVLAFSDEEPGTWGPRRVSAAEIRQNFAAGWILDALEPAEYVTFRGPARAWLASLTRS